jgi:membrane protease YdiL (CAAX protease family)
MNEPSTSVTGLGTPAAVGSVGEGSSGPGSRRPDPGTPLAAKVAVVLALVLLAVLVGLNMLEAKQTTEAARVEAAAAEGDESKPPTASDPFLMNAKLMVKLGHSGFTDGTSTSMLETNIEKAATTDTDRLRAVMLKADMTGDAEALTALQAARTLADETRSRGGETNELPAWWAEDAARLEAVLAGGEKGTSANLDELKKRHGWFAEVLATRGMEMNDPARAAAVGGGGALILLVAVASIVGFGAFVGAIVAGVFVVVGLAKGKFRPAFVPPLPGGSVYLETLAAFLVGFLMLKVVFPWVLLQTGVLKPNEEGPEWLTTATLACQWLLLPIIFWPLLRGVSWERWRKDVGWHSGAGFWKEVGAGVYAYFGGLPLLALAAIITLLIVFIRAALQKSSGEVAAPPVNPILELLEHASPFAIFMLFVLATVWAPIVEETLFRGGLFRHLRGRLGVVVSAVLSAVWFGLMHSYELPLLLPVITLGFVFALMREWRGSLIPSVVAHGLHNATVLSLAIGFMSALS